MSERIRLFVGSSPHGMDAETEMALAWSVAKNCSMPVDITWMRATDHRGDLWGGWNREQWATPFSGFRWAVAEAAGGAGRAIYMDNDLLVLGDLAELWNADMGGKPIMARWPGRLCVSVWDCAAALDILPSIAAMKADPSSHARLQDSIERGYIAKLDPLWNCLDGETVPLDEIKGLHFTDMSTQPAAELAVQRLSGQGREHWFRGTRYQHVRPDAVALFHRHVREAIDAGYRLDDYGALPSRH